MHKVCHRCAFVHVLLNAILLSTSAVSPQNAPHLLITGPWERAKDQRPLRSAQAELSTEKCGTSAASQSLAKRSTASSAARTSASSDQERAPRRQNASRTAPNGALRARAPHRVHALQLRRLGGELREVGRQVLLELRGRRELVEGAEALPRDRVHLLAQR